MARKKKNVDMEPEVSAPIIIDEQNITETLTTNFMPYAMSIIVSRAIPEIDGFKPSHRKLLYTMHKMGLLNSNRTKSANVVGQTMRLNPHGDAAIYETLVRLTTGNEALNHPFIDSKGNFGKVYSRDMAYAASRYTEVKLDSICSEIFSDIDSDSVDFVPNYDNTMKEPTLLPTTFPNILVSSNQGIAAGMASYIASFNLAEVCETTIALIKNKNHDIHSTLPAPDFPTGGELIYNRSQMEAIYETGRGSFKLRAKWRCENNVIEIYEIPYTTSIEAILDKCTDLIKTGKAKEIADMRDETDLSGLKLAIDLKRGVDPEMLMQKLFRSTPLEDTVSCNFNILVGGAPMVLGIRDILDEWIAWRTECVRRRTYFELEKKRERLHLLEGLSKILLDIDKAIAIIRSTEEEREVIPNLMIGFGIDEIQAEYIAEIKLRNINKEYILKRLEELDELRKTIGRLEDILRSKAKLQNIIVTELTAVIKKYRKDRRTEIVHESEIPEFTEEDETPDYPATVFVTESGYFKKITPQSLRMSGEQKLKEGDRMVQVLEVTNRNEIVFITNLCNAYKAKVSDFEDSKASVLGDFLPAQLEMEDDEYPLFTFVPSYTTDSLIFCYENGKVTRVPVSSYETKSNRRKLTGACSDKSPLKGAFHIHDDIELALINSGGRMLLFNTASIAPKTTRSAQGVTVMTLKKGLVVESAATAEELSLKNPRRYRTKTLPAAGAILRPEDSGQMSIE
ncbi:MAG: topoisomerase IV [Clostridiales bacterium]|nr:topoisomerase IV [Clostridiales bacterium]